MVHVDVQILSERALPNGLAFQASVRETERAPALARSIEVRLHWADYNLWSIDGADAPERVAAAVLRFAASRVALADLPESFDASTLRRRHADADETIAGHLRRGSG
ncbi:MAG: hypothetical protein U0575_05205 [Phycisphaerales bacterium]